MHKRYNQVLLPVFILFLVGCGGKEMKTDSTPGFESTSTLEEGEATLADTSGEIPGYGTRVFDEIEIPSEVAPFINSPYKAYDIIRGDLTGDQLEDYIVILYNPSDYQNNPHDAIAPVLFLTRQQDHKLKLHTKHDNLIGLENLGSYMHRIEIAIDSVGGGFRVTYHTEGYSIYGSWTDVDAHFSFDNAKKDWLLQTLSYYGGAISPGAQREREAEMAGDTALLELIRSGEDDDEAYTGEDEEDGEPYLIKTVKDFGILPLSKFSREGVFDE